SGRNGTDHYTDQRRSYALLRLWFLLAGRASRETMAPAMVLQLSSATDVRGCLRVGTPKSDGRRRSSPTLPGRWLEGRTGQALPGRSVRWALLFLLAGFDVVALALLSNFLREPANAAVGGTATSASPPAMSRSNSAARSPPVNVFVSSRCVRLSGSV